MDSMVIHSRVSFTSARQRSLFRVGTRVWFKCEAKHAVELDVGERCSGIVWSDGPWPGTLWVIHEMVDRPLTVGYSLWSFCVDVKRSACSDVPPFPALEVGFQHGCIWTSEER